MKEEYSAIEQFIESTRDVIYMRGVDKLLIIRPNKIQHINQTAFEMLDLLYHKHKTVEEVINTIAVKYKITDTRVGQDLNKLIQSLSSLLKDDFSKAPAVTTIPFDPQSVKYPVISEIALTYGCNNKCEWCYASSPHRKDEQYQMTTAEVKTVIDKIKTQAHVPTISFTGGEPTLREDLPELITYAKSIGMRVNLISNGIRAGSKQFAEKLAKAGLDSAQISLESHDAEIHDDIVGHPGAHKHTTAAIKNLQQLGIYTHTNTTISHTNKTTLIETVRYIKQYFDLPHISMNMIIRTGEAKTRDNSEISYSTIGEILKPVLEECEILGMKIFWYSPTPYCIFNPIDHNLGAKSCAAVSGLLSVNPAGDILPCSSYDSGIGNLLKNDFDSIYNSDAATYFREKRYRPPVCRDCKYLQICGGACPLYWEDCNNFEEIESKKNTRKPLKNIAYKIEKKLRLKTNGVDSKKTEVNHG